MTSKRKLTTEEIEDIIKCLYNNESSYALQRAGESNYVKTVRKDLNECLMNPNLIPELKKRIIDLHQRSLVQTGEMVGSLASQCIGQPLTQTFLNTFHLAGVAQKQNDGTGRLNDLLNATSNLKHPMIEFQFDPRPYLNDASFLKEGEISSFERCLVRKLFEYHNLSYFVSGTRVTVNRIPTKYKRSIKMYEVLYRKLPDNFAVAILQLDSLAMYRCLFDWNEVTERLRYDFDDIDVFFVPKAGSSSPSLVIVFDLSDCCKIIGRKGEELHKFVHETENMSIDHYLTFIAIPKLLDERISGIEGIKRIDVERKDKGILFVSAVGSNLNDLRLVRGVDRNSVYTKDLHEMFNCYGIETTREWYLMEYRKLASDDLVESRHIELLVDSSTYETKPTPVSRNGMSVAVFGPIAKASFEQTFETFRRAGATSHFDYQKSLSSSIVLGTFKNFGTGIGHSVKPL